CQQCNTSPWTF
nr:immunoglobulin light chain junction region [Macaca mulatta]MPN88896.1 immunoglobulin light chain junction region [Macaca mulatta]